MPALVALLALLPFAMAGGADPPVAWVFDREAVVVEATAGQQDFPLEGQRWLARQGAAVWVLEPALGRVVLLAGASGEAALPPPQAS